MNNSDNKMLPATRRRPPTIQFVYSERYSSSKFPGDEVLAIVRPLYKVTVNAPGIDTMVSIALAKLL